MSDLAEKDAYDTAFAVFGPAVRFAEWTIYQVNGTVAGSWYPFPIQGDRLLHTWKEIEGIRWIYAFESSVVAGGGPGTDKVHASRWVGEFNLDERGQLFATPMESVLAAAKAAHDVYPERDKRGIPVLIGTTVSFVRQLFGRPVTHYFFSSRIQLPTKAITLLEKNIGDWTQGITFEPTDRNITQNGGTSVVPVLDPLTIALHLHAFFAAASKDLTKYMTPIDDPDDPDSAGRKDRAHKRQRKLQIAQLVDTLTDPKTTPDGGLVAKVDQARLDDFLKDYERQVQYRKQWRNRWATYLCNWLQAPPLTMLADAHQVDTAKDFPDFLVYMAQSHSGISETPQGRALLQLHFERPLDFPWVQRYALGREKLSDDMIQAIRKTGTASLELLKEHAPVWMVRQSSTVAQDFCQALDNMFGVGASPTRVVYKGEEHGWFAWINDLEGGGQFKGTGPIDYVELVKVNTEGKHKFKEMWKGGAEKLLAGIELINFALAVKSFNEAYKGNDLRAKVLSFTNLVGAGLDLSTATLSLFELASKKTLEKLSFYSAVIDTVLGAIETVDDLSKGKFGQAGGSAIVTIGSFIIAVGILAEIPGAGEIGMAIVAIGYFIKEIFRDDTDYERLIDMSSFGNREAISALDEKPTWFDADKTFRTWDTDLDEQLHAAVMLLCKFTVATYTGTLEERQAHRDELLLRKVLITMGWIPGKTKVDIVYMELWVTSTDNRTMEGTIEFDAGAQPKMTSTQLELDTSDPTALKAQPRTSAVTHSPLSTDVLWGEDKPLILIAVSAELSVDFGDRTHKIKAPDVTLYDRKTAKKPAYPTR